MCQLHEGNQCQWRGRRNQPEATCTGRLENCGIEDLTGGDAPLRFEGRDLQTGACDESGFSLIRRQPEGSLFYILGESSEMENFYGNKLKNLSLVAWAFVGRLLSRSKNRT